MSLPFSNLLYPRSEIGLVDMRILYKIDEQNHFVLRKRDDYLQMNKEMCFVFEPFIFSIEYIFRI